METMKVKILKTTVADKSIVRAGDVLDLNEVEAKFLIGIKKAEKIGFVDNLKNSIEAATLKPALKRGRKKKEL